MLVSYHDQYDCECISSSFSCRVLMKNMFFNAVISGGLSLVALVSVTFFVAWLLEDSIYFSLFIGIPCGIVAALVVFGVVVHYLKD